MVCSRFAGRSASALDFAGSAVKSRAPCKLKGRAGKQDFPYAPIAANLCSTQLQGQRMTSLHPGIDAANRDFMDAVRTADEQRFVTLYATDAILLLPGREPLIGHEGARTFFESFRARGVHLLKLTTLEVEVFDGTAWERGSSEVAGVDGAVFGRGKYIVIWKRTATGWKLYRDIMNA